ncbi:acyltransferase 3 [Acrodontium crateriforme]|uniref:Acyltransferase 3 n=1 Tax=Acrodontium crateriforme TaxID=150365 RepID=A0AAQ3LXQ3_9PEZI|nr:acyltransferase 3 [Acrodontium crateriforme]
MAIPSSRVPLLDETDLEEASEQMLNRKSQTSPLSSRIWGTFLRVLSLILPSWLRFLDQENILVRQRKMRPTAYLDGIRGLVSLLVFLRHFALPWQVHLDYGYGHQNAYHDILRLPFLRLLFSGPLVPLFFVVSGYVLSAKTLKLGRQSAWEQLFLSLASSTFRRAFRLFLPPLFSTIVVMLLAYSGCFSFDYDIMPGREPVHPVALESLGLQMVQWLKFSFGELTNPWSWSRRNMLYGPHLWTIPVSFQGSLVVFLTCLGLARTKTYLRSGFLVIYILLTEMHGRWDIAPFIGGVLLCELDLSAASTTTDVSMSPIWSWRARMFNIALLILGLYVGSFPRFNGHGNSCVPGYQLFCDITADYRYWHGISALVVLLALSREPGLRFPLETSLVQYLGKISFSLYIIHEPFIHIVGFRTVPLFWMITGEDVAWRYQAGFVLGLFCSAFMLLWIADIFKTLIEDRCANLAAKIESVCFENSE